MRTSFYRSLPLTPPSRWSPVPSFGPRRRAISGFLGSVTLPLFEPQFPSLKNGGPAGDETRPAQEARAAGLTGDHLGRTEPRPPGPGRGLTAEPGAQAHPSENANRVFPSPAFGPSSQSATKTAARRVPIGHFPGEFLSTVPGVRRDSLSGGRFPAAQPDVWKEIRDRQAFARSHTVHLFFVLSSLLCFRPRVIMAFWTQLMLLLWKNYTYRRRQPVTPCACRSGAVAGVHHGPARSPTRSLPRSNY